MERIVLLEFKKDPERVLLVVAHKPCGKKNWMVSDQDLTLLEFVWIELLEKNKSIRVEELAEMIFGSAEPLESYCVHLLLLNDDIYFTVLESKGSFSVYGPRPAVQVDELLWRKHAKEAIEKELKEFVKSS
ncbi:Ribonuclease II [Forsythia ovata]|uniref:Ribonuclease II n=1 Tax=Forsythia ovata TaxID=205694 RepID=A0ABD1TPL9_9LAMI